MKPRYTISIPKPCHENWSEMTPNEKGRFCQSCSKTVVDFTKMNTNEVQEFIHEHKHHRICGHIRQNQLDAVNLQISETVFEQTMSFHKLFLLALLLAMGTSLFSCSDDNGQAKKIESVEIIKTAIDSTAFEAKTQVDSTASVCSTKEKQVDSIAEKIPPPPPPISTPTGIVIVEGDVDIVDTNYPLTWYTVDEKPNFIDAPKNLPKKDIKAYFNTRMRAFVLEHFNIKTAANLGLNGRQRIYIKFTIDAHGNVKDIDTRAPHPLLDEEAKRVIGLLPKFSPAKYDGEPVAVAYNLPIAFNMED
ncbi:energy transducer TonB [uncultured Psychroserpens sp.]|uniref:energy transducer TonB n=1 Tax=uncultured Psychroserpens sp. TaxID=255436 RepID=UPI00260B63A3|nr:energy transducer TonB [uncultured Psychroserpens sp.]